MLNYLLGKCSVSIDIHTDTTDVNLITNCLYIFSSKINFKKEIIIILYKSKIFYALKNESVFLFFNPSIEHEKFQINYL